MSRIARRRVSRVDIWMAAVAAVLARIASALSVLAAILQLALASWAHWTADTSIAGGVAMAAHTRCPANGRVSGFRVTSTALSAATKNYQALTEQEATQIGTSCSYR
jgi:hypothetical protein